MKIALLAGEQSGDQLGAALAKALKQKREDVELIGVVGAAMRAAGVTPLASLDELQVMGFIEVLPASIRLVKNFYSIRNQLLHHTPDVIVTIDFQEFNLLMIKSLRHAGFKGRLIHYVSPSVWAWRSGRARTLQKNVDDLLTLFHFEKQLYTKTESALAVHFVGHPLQEQIPEQDTSKEKLIAIMPGSRASVIKKNLPLQLQAAYLISQQLPDYRFAISIARLDLEPLIEKIAKKSKLYKTNTVFFEKNRFELMQRAAAALATSGTITLELALHEVPTVVNYAVGLVNGFIAKYLLRISLSHYCIVNILARQTVFAEYVCLKPSAIAMANAFIKQLNEREKIVQLCRLVRQELGEGSGSEKAADVVLQCKK